MYPWHILMATLTFSTGLIVETPPVLANAFEPPPERNAPRSTAGGGSRPATESSCTFHPDSGLRATALAPQSFIGLTHQAPNQVWLYQPTNEAQSIEISVFDQNLNGLAQFELTSPGTPGFLAVDLAEHITLAADTPYYWTAAFICSPHRRTEDWVVGGWIKHQPLSTSNQPTLAPIDQVKQLMGTGYWYDAFKQLLLLSQTTPESSNLEELWNSLTQQADLELPWATVNNVIHISQQ